MKQVKPCPFECNANDCKDCGAYTYSHHTQTNEECANSHNKLYTVKVYSNSGCIISYWDNVINSVLDSNKNVHLKLDNGKSVTVVGGIIVVEEE